ncbi:PE family protein [Mycobacterium sp. 23]|uniref:PE family protein n=1 Tax=Mycobacterium sp. 23 TaxID=3400424 RepID=UPI003AB06DC3
MSFTIVPEAATAAAADLAGVGESIRQAVAQASAPTTGVVTAAADEVSHAIAALFSGHGEAFQAASAQVAAFHDQFVALLNGSVGQYVSAEAASANPLLDFINSPFQTFLGRPLIGDGANGFTDAAGNGTNGGAGGLLWGNGGRGGDSTAIGAVGGRGGNGGLLWGNGGAGGNAGPGELTIVGGVPLSVHPVPMGGAGGQGSFFFGNGGTGGAGGSLVRIEDGVPVITPLAGYGGRGGDSGILIGTGGFAGPGLLLPGTSPRGGNGLLGGPWPW